MNPIETELLDALADMVMQHCRDESLGGGTSPNYSSGFLSANANAMRLLAKYGRMAILHDGRTVPNRDGRGVIGYFTEARP